jgi:saccharopine dehydrogenase-like NADP-dependent oxidoreductase
MHDVVILGAGKIGRTVAQMLARTGEYRLRIGDTDEKSSR